MTIPVTRVPNVRKMGCSVGRMVKGQILFAAPSTEHSHRPERVGCGLQGQISLQAQTCSDRNDHCFEGHNGNGHRLGQNPPIRACRSQLKSFYPSIYILCTSVWNFFSDQHIHNDNRTVTITKIQKNISFAENCSIPLSLFFCLALSVFSQLPTAVSPSSLSSPSLQLGKGGATKSDDFFGKNLNGLQPPLIFGELYCNYL